MNNSHLPSNVINIFDIADNTEQQQQKAVVDDMLQTHERSLTTSAAFDYENAKQGTTHWNVPTINKSQIGLSLTDQIENSGVLFPVDGRENFTLDNDGNLIDTGFQTIFNLLTGAVLSIQTQGYKIALMRQICDTALSAINQCPDLPLENAFIRAKVDGEGKKIRLEIIFPQTGFEVAVGDQVAFCITIINSYDGSDVYSVSCGSFRFWCANGNVSLKPIVQVRQKHTQSLEVERATSIIVKGLASYVTDQADMMLQVETKVSEQEVYEALAIVNKIDVSLAPSYEEYQRVIRPTLKRQPIIEKHMALWAKYKREIGCSQWALHNVLTHIATHGNDEEFSGNQSVSGRADKEKLAIKALRHVVLAA